MKDTKLEDLWYSGGELGVRVLLPLKSIHITSPAAKAEGLSYHLSFLPVQGKGLTKARDSPYSLAHEVLAWAVLAGPFTSLSPSLLPFLHPPQPSLCHLSIHFYIRDM